MNRRKLFCLRIKRFLYLINEKKIFGFGTFFSHVTYCLAGNSGDTALSWCVRRVLENNFAVKRWNIISVIKKVDEHTVKGLNKTNAVIIGGGGLFLPDTNKNSVSGWQWAIRQDFLCNIKKPIIVFGVGYNFFYGQKVTELFQENLNVLLEKSSFFGLRNIGSVNAVKNIVNPSLRDKVVYQPCITTLIRKIYNLPEKIKTGTIAFNFAFDRVQLRFGNKKEIIIEKLVNSMKLIKNKGYKVVIVAHMPEDLEILNYTNNEFDYIDTSRFLPKDLFNFYNHIDMVIGMRGHSQMIPFGLNCEILSLCSHEKMKWFLSDIECSDWGIDLNSNENYLDELIVSKFSEIHEKNADITAKRLIEAQNKLYEITMNNISKIKVLLKER